MKYLQVVLRFIVFGVLVVLLQTQYAYHFFNIEQNQLFQNTPYYVAEHLFRPGGAALVASEFLVQFFMLPYMGAVITALLVTLAGVFTSLILKRIVPKTDGFVLGMIPALFLLFSQFNINYLTHGTVAFVFLLITLWAVLCIGNPAGRMAVHFLATFVLFCIAGPVYIVYASAAALYELMSKSPRNYLALLLLLEAALIGVGSVYFQLYPQYRFAFLPDAYYHSRQTPPGLIYFSWIALLALIVIALLLKDYSAGKKKSYILFGIQTILVTALCIWGLSEYDDAKSYRVKMLDYYCRTEQWDKIPELCKGKLTNYLYTCYLNIALMEKGELADKMFSYDQLGPKGLMVNWNMTAPVSVLLSDVYFATNNTAMAQTMAFEANVGSITAANPRVLKRLVQTNLIFGAYPVAEKYIRILESTRCYKDWAKEQRRFLYNDKAVEADPLLGAKRRSLPSENTLTYLGGVGEDLMRIVKQNPSAKSSIEFMGCAYLLAKDVQGFGNFLDTYYGTEALPVLPKSFREAVITLYEAMPEKWEEYNVPPATIERFYEFKKQILANKNNPAVLPGLLNRSYGDTFWYYFMFKDSRQ